MFSSQKLIVLFDKSCKGEGGLDASVGWSGVVCTFVSCEFDNVVSVWSVGWDVPLLGVGEVGFIGFSN